MEKTSATGALRRSNEQREKPSWRREELLLPRNDDIRREWRVNNKIGTERSGT